MNSALHHRLVRHCVTVDNNEFYLSVDGWSHHLQQLEASPTSQRCTSIGDEQVVAVMLTSGQQYTIPYMPHTESVKVLDLAHEWMWDYHNHEGTDEVICDLAVYHDNGKLNCQAVNLHMPGKYTNAQIRKILNKIGIKSCL